MRYVEYLSNSTYSKIGISHSVLVHKGKVLSYEIWLTIWRGKFYIYDYEEWLLSVSKIKKVQILNIDFDIEEYEGVEYEGIVCFEAIQIILKNFDYQDMNSIKKRTTRIITIFIALGIYGILIFLFWYYGFSMSEDDYITYKESICQQ